jgi:hypothetical protein
LLRALKLKKKKAYSDYNIIKIKILSHFDIQRGNFIMANYGLTINGNIRVFRKDKVITGKNKKSYDITDVWFNVSEKNEDETYFNRSMNLIFKRGIELPSNNQVISILSAFPMITGNGDYRKIAFYVEAWLPVEQEV